MDQLVNLTQAVWHGKCKENKQNANRNESRTVKNKSMKTLLRTKPTWGDKEAPALEIRFQFVDGSVANFFQPESEIAENIWRRINVAHLFTRPRIVIADDFSKSVVV